MNYPVLFSYLGVLLLLFAVGFILGTKGPFSYGVGESLNPLKMVSSIFRVLLIVSILIAIKSWVEFLLSSKSLSLTSLGQNYVSSYDGYVRGEGQIGFTYILDIFESAITVITILFTFSHYRIFSKRAKVAAVFIIITYLLINVIGSGKQKYLGDIVVFFVYAVIIKSATLNIKYSLKKLSIVLLSIVTIIILFSVILSQRYSAIEIDASNIANSIHPLMYWDEDAPILLLFGDISGFAIGMFLGYFTNGLCGLNLALTLPFEWTYFLGSSYSLARILESFIGMPDVILANSYPYRVEQLGWGMDKWHSLFPWLASDITFWGVLVVTLLFAYIYGRVWISSLKNINPFARPLFIYFSLGVIFSFSNNQLMHSLSGCIVLLFLMLFYIICKKRIDKNEI